MRTWTIVARPIGGSREDQRAYYVDAASSQQAREKFAWFWPELEFINMF